jgi:MFS transporter, AAHS family, 4-hydroxybenzoate transporter
MKLAFICGVAARPRGRTALGEGKQRVDIAAVIEEQPTSALQYLVFTLCTLVCFVDGYDMVSIGYVAPSLRAEFHFDAATLGPIFSAGIFGMVAGGLFFGPLADRIGRRLVLSLSCLIFGAGTVLTAMTDSFLGLLLARLAVGFGLGGASANAFAMVAEYAAKRIAATVVVVANCGVGLGAAFGGLLAAHLIPELGWRSVLYVGGVSGVALGLALLVLLPESLRFLAAHGRHAAAARYLRRVAPGLARAGSELWPVSSEEVQGGFPVRHLFTNGRAAGTVLLWVIIFFNMMEIYTVNQWLPLLINKAGVALPAAISAGALFQTGVVAGALVLSRLVTRSAQPYRLLALLQLGAAVSFVALGSAGSTVAIVMPVVFVNGIFVGGVLFNLSALAAGYYPTYIRSTGVAWAIGIGRSGGVVGPMLGSLLLALNLDAARIFSFAGVPALCEALAALTMAWVLTQRAALREAAAE